MFKRLTLVIIGSAIVAVVGVAVLIASQNKPAPVTQTTDQTAPTAPEPAQTPATPTEQSTAKTPGTYTAYSNEAVQKTSGTKILFFHAPWCPQCRSLDKSINESTIPDNVTIFKVDYDSNQALRQKYGVTIQTTLIKIDDAGNLVAKYVAYDQPNFQAVKEHLL